MALECIEIIAASVVDALLEGRKVRIFPLGKFDVIHHSARRTTDLRNPEATVLIPAHFRPIFTPSPQFRRSLRGIRPASGSRKSPIS